MQQYERFCIDYVSFKHRLLHTGGVHDDFLGGYGFGNVVPPHNTATAGYGEALAAAIAILRARSEDSSWAEDDMRAVMAFLLKNQWSREACYACDHPNRVVGAFSEHMASPQIRIDYVQHAWAALGHGARVLALEKRGDG